MPDAVETLVILLKHARDTNIGDPELCSCGCGMPLEPALDGVPYKFSGKLVNSDCYFSIMAAIVDEDPAGIGIPRK